MCFSATASFGVAAALIPVGAYCVTRAARSDRRWLPLAACPLAFGLQQAVEGTLWLGIGAGDAALVATAARGFLFFSHFFWLFWVPLSVLTLETEARRRRVLVVLTILGGLFGASIYLPVLLNEGWLVVGVAYHSITYKVATIYDDAVPNLMLRVVYAAIILSSLFIGTARGLRTFAVLILGSVVVAHLTFDYAFTSVWCFFAALLSLYILHMVRNVLAAAP